MSSTLETLLTRYQGKLVLSISEISTILGYRENSCRNLISRGDFPIHTFLMGSRRVARTDTVAQYLDHISGIQPPKRRGPKTKAEKIAAAKQGVSHG